MLGARIAQNSILHANVEISLRHPITGGGAITIGKNCELSYGTVLHPYRGHITIQDDVFIGPNVVIYGHGGVDIGEQTLIAMHCRILSSEHTIPDFGTDIRGEPDIPKPTRIGRDVWLGAGVTVLGGLTIGDGCIIGAGSVVTHNIPPGAVAFGVPAKVKSYRSHAYT